MPLLLPLPPGGVGGFPLKEAPAAPADAEVVEADEADAVGLEFDALSGAASLASADEDERGEKKRKVT